MQSVQFISSDSLFLLLTI